jgi:hypothetical protein
MAAVEIEFKNTPVLLQTPVGDIKWNHPTIKVSNLFYDRKAGFKGPIEVTDYSGFVFSGVLVHIL